jgi:hypothetical protein
MNKAVLLGAVAFAITMAVLIGQRLSDQAMAVIVGSVVGVAASVPMAGVILWLTLRQREGTHTAPTYPRPEYTHRDETPRMIVIQPQPNYAPPAGQYQSQTALPQIAAPTMNYMRPMRDFKIVGQEEFEDEDRNALV